jgi:hypothetical protein
MGNGNGVQKHLNFDEECKAHTTYFKEYVGSLVCFMAGQMTEESEVEGLFDAIDARNNHEHLPEMLEIRKELRDKLTTKINTYRERFEVERSR